MRTATTSGWAAITSRRLPAGARVTKLQPLEVGDGSHDELVASARRRSPRTRAHPPDRDAGGERAALRAARGERACPASAGRRCRARAACRRRGPRRSSAARRGRCRRRSPQRGGRRRAKSGSVTSCTVDRLAGDLHDPADEAGAGDDRHAHRRRRRRCPCRCSIVCSKFDDGRRRPPRGDGRSMSPTHSRPCCSSELLELAGGVLARHGAGPRARRCCSRSSSFSSSRSP